LKLEGWSNKGRRGKDGRKGRGSASTPLEVPSNFSAVVAPMVLGVESKQDVEHKR